MRSWGRSRVVDNHAHRPFQWFQWPPQYPSGDNTRAWIMLSEMFSYPYSDWKDPYSDRKVGGRLWEDCEISPIALENASVSLSKLEKERMTNHNPNQHKYYREYQLCRKELLRSQRSHCCHCQVPATQRFQKYVSVSEYTMQSSFHLFVSRLPLFTFWSGQPQS